MAITNPGKHGLLCGTHNLQVIDLVATSLLVDCYASSYGIDVEACSHSKPRLQGWLARHGAYRFEFAERGHTVCAVGIKHPL